ncbi:PAS domain-containing sensor histidine kinase [Azohydromonas caseinilytica]|uniref:histidine kinase n=1 Tax=Azohydromonas caseinilytica TaxID=2728836 RepID=A0A848FBM0_9BURK|nr:ATP-binding protein [Azohydromonas caseinilytica]NML16296.1 PAS domain S-box protein [Azohydromonas caseinilytica]
MKALVLLREALPGRVRRTLLWGALVALLLVAQTLLVMLTVRYEASRQQEAVEAQAEEVAAELRHTVLRSVQALQALLWSAGASAPWQGGATELLRTQREVLRVERRGDDMALLGNLASPYAAPLFEQLGRDQMSAELEPACAAARRASAPAFSRSYFVPQPGGLGVEVIDACIPVQRDGRPDGFVVLSFGLGALLEEAAGGQRLRRHEFSIIEVDGTRLARAGMARGAGVYHARHLLELPGSALQLRVDSAEGSPRLIPNLATALVLGLSVVLFALLLLLARDVRRRAQAERALAEALAFRKAMEDSLSTGLRARTLDGRISYVNQAFCAMVGFSAEELRHTSPPPYWPPECVEEYTERQAMRMRAEPVADPHLEGFETVFMRRNGERFPVMIYETPLVDGAGRHTGWMSAVLDMSAQRRVEELSRQQQERLQATARLATVGEMASLLSHELNQPLAAIASYATGSLNLLQQPDDQTHDMLRHAVTRIAEQAERAGRVIKSVHDFVRRREQARESIRADQLIDAVLPLVRLQARKSGTRIELEYPDPIPRVMCDRTMLEQVLLNLTRNGIQAMETATPLAQRVLRLRVQPASEGRVGFAVVDAGPGIPAEVAQRLFTPFFTTRSEGMGLGLSLCRTVIEQHGGALEFESLPPLPDGPGGTEFRFTLPDATRVPRAAPLRA